MKHIIAMGAALALLAPAGAAPAAPQKEPAKAEARAVPKAGVDRSGKPRKGKASYYSKKFHYKKTADGEPLDPNSNMAASKTLPLGTKAQVTNLETGKSAVVEIADRGPYVDGRIVDVTPKVAEKLEMKEDGVAPVVVKPLALPPKEDGKKEDGKEDKEGPARKQA